MFPKDGIDSLDSGRTKYSLCLERWVLYITGTPVATQAVLWRASPAPFPCLDLRLSVLRTQRFDDGSCCL